MQSATLPIAQAFNLAFEYLKSAKERRRGDVCSSERTGKRDNKVIHANSDRQTDRQPNIFVKIFSLKVSNSHDHYR